MAIVVVIVNGRGLGIDINAVIDAVRARSNPVHSPCEHASGHGLIATALI